MTQETRETAPPRAKTSLREICRRIEVAYRCEKTMYDPPLVSLVEELSTRTSEIVELIDLFHELDGYNTFDATGVEVDERFAALKLKARGIAQANKPPVRQLFADAAGCLVETTDPNADPVEFSPQGGGFVYLMKQDRFRETFKAAKTPAIQRARFTADWLPADMSVEGFTDGMRWNGWGMPMFPLEEAQRLIPHTSGLRYDAAIDAFIMNDPDNDPETGEVYSGKTITVDGKAIKVYAIGAGSWCWDPAR
jgi:hypothetical protein